MLIIFVYIQNIATSETDGSDIYSFAINYVANSKLHVPRINHFN